MFIYATQTFTATDGTSCTAGNTYTVTDAAGQTAIMNGQAQRAEMPNYIATPYLSEDKSGNTNGLGDPVSGANFKVSKGHVTLYRAAAQSINYNVGTGVIFDTLYDNATNAADAAIWNGTTDTDALIIPNIGISHVRFMANVGIPTSFVPTSPDIAASIRLTIQNNYSTILPLTPALHVMFQPPTYDTTGHLGIMSGWIPCVAGDKFNLIIKHEASTAVSFGNGLALYMQAEFK